MFGGKTKMRLASRPAPPCCAPAPAPPSWMRSRCAPCSRSSLYDYSKNGYNLHSMRRAGKVYPHEIGIQETHTKHRKLDSQATLSHRARDRAADRLRPQAWPLRPSRRDHDPCRLSPRPAGLGGLRPAMAANRALRVPPPRSRVKNGIPSVHPIRGDEMRALRKLRRDYPRDAHVFVSERGGPISPIGFHRLIQRLGEAAKMPFPIHPHMLRHACGYKLANDGHDTRALQHYLRHKNIQHTVRYTDMATMTGQDPSRRTERSSHSKKTTRHIVEITRPLAVGPCVACAPSGRPRCRPPASLCSWVWENRAAGRLSSPRSFLPALQPALQARS